MILGVLASSAGAPSWASLIVDGLTYTLYESTLSTTEDQFTLVISGINGTGAGGTPLDTEGGRYGVGSFALTEPVAGSVSTGSLAGFAFMTGGLNSMGCNGKGNLYCFRNNKTPSAPALAANSSLTFTFDVILQSADAGDFANYDPSFKIDWIGTKNNYNLVSETLTPTPVPLPAALPLLLGGIASLGFLSRRKAGLNRV